MKTRLDHAYHLGRKWRRRNIFGNPYLMTPHTSAGWFALASYFLAGWRDQDAELAAEMS